MIIHDNLCDMTTGRLPATCHCEVIEKARADERAKFEHWTNKAISEKREAEVRADERNQIGKLLADELWKQNLEQFIDEPEKLARVSSYINGLKFALQVLISREGEQE